MSDAKDNSDPRVTKRISINAPFEAVYEALGSNFFDAGKALTGPVESCEKDGDGGGKQGNEVGAKRIINKVIFETQLRNDKSADSAVVSYRIDSAEGTPLAALTPIVGTVYLYPTVDEQTHLVWTAAWDKENEESEKFADGLYIALCQAAAKNMGK